MSNKYYALKGQNKFDISKITVVGSPTITSDGVASGFTTAKYIASSTTLTINPNIFRICFEFTTGSDITTAQMIIRSMDGQNAFIIGLKSRKMRLSLNAEDSPHSWDIAIDILSTKGLTANTKYSGCLSFNGFTYTLNLNNEDWITVESSVLMRSSFALKIGQGMSGEPFLGSVNLQAIRVYSNNELIYSPTIPTCLLERRKAKVWNKGQFTIVGNPSISESGVASGFSTSDYLTTPAINLTDNFKLSATFQTGNDISLSQAVFSSKTTMAISLNVLNNTYILYLSSNNSSYDIFNANFNLGTAKPNTLYNFYLEQKDGQIIIYLYENGVKLTEKIIATTKTIYQNISNGFNIGSHRANTSEYFRGSIDLKQFKIYTNNNLVFDGGAETYVYDPSKFTVVGSPTITGDGVASGFTSGNYLKTNSTFNYGNSFEILFNFTYKTSSVHQYLVSTTTEIGIICGIYSGGRIFLTLGANNSAFIPESSGKTYLVDGQDYYFLLSYKNGAYILKISIDGSNWIEEINKPYETQALPNGKGLNFGTNRNGAASCTCSINLPSISITVDGKEVFTGAKEVFYALRM